VEEAIKHWEQALRINPDLAEVHYNLGLWLERTGKTQEAVEHYRQAVRINPNFVEAKEGLAQHPGAGSGDVAGTARHQP
jgi:tetratricopeptide (TPR) repeat protein